MSSCGTVVGSPSQAGPAPDTLRSSASCGAGTHPLVSGDPPLTFPTFIIFKHMGLGTLLENPRLL